jgi:homoserine kinase
MIIENMLEKKIESKVRAFAPASIANLFVGFDILGLSFDQIGDIVILENFKSDSKDLDIKIKVIDQKSKLPLTTISTIVEKNTAGMALLTLMQEEKIFGSIEMTIEKGIPLSSGLGGSAASAIGAVVAANKIFQLNLSHEKCIHYALAGEYVASKGYHADNLAPSLFGGLNLIYSHNPVKIISIPAPKLWVAIIHPHMELETSKARGVLKETILKTDWIAQSQFLAGFMSACYTNDLDLFESTLRDLIIEPQRKHLIKGFDRAKEVALEWGAMGFTISGAGPTMVGISRDQKSAELITKKCSEVLELEFEMSSDLFVSKMDSLGARIL